MLLSVTSLLAALTLWTTLSTSVSTDLRGHVFVHADLDGDGKMELIVSDPGSCDQDGRCLMSVLQPDGHGGYQTLLSATRMWDLSPGSRQAGQWLDLVEARRDGPCNDDITVVLWRFKGDGYRRVDSTLTKLPSTPAWADDGVGVGR